MATDGSLNAAKRKWKMPLSVFFQDARQVFNPDGLGREILGIAFPAALASAADPIASLIDTAFIGHIGPVELAAAGVSMALFNQASRITIFPLVSITTFFVAEEDTTVNLKAAETDAKELAVSEDAMLQEVEQGSSSVEISENTTSESLGNSTSENNEIKEPVLSAEDEKANNEAAVKNDKDNFAEEDAIVNLKAAETNPKELAVSEDAMLQDVEQGSSSVDISENTSSESLGNSTSENSGIKEPVLSAEDEKANNEAAVKNDTNTSACKPSPESRCNRGKAVKAVKEKRHIASLSTALLFGTLLGLIQAAILIFAAKPLLAVMGVKNGSPMLQPAEKYLRLRALGAPAAVQALAMQGIFRDFKDTKTPLYVIICGYGINVALDPILIFHCKLGIRGAALAYVLCQHMMAVVLFFILMKKMDLLPPSAKDLQIFRFLKNGGLLLARVVAVTFVVTLSASLAARLGAIPMTAFQPCLQVLVSVVSVAAVFVLYKTEGFIGIWIALSICMALHMLAGIWGMGIEIGPWKFLRGLL